MAAEGASDGADAPSEDSRQPTEDSIRKPPEDPSRPAGITFPFLRRMQGHTGKRPEDRPITASSSATSADGGRPAEGEGEQVDDELETQRSEQRSEGARGSAPPNPAVPTPPRGEAKELETEEAQEEDEVDEDHLPDDEKAALQWERYRSRNRPSGAGPLLRQRCF